MQETKIWDFPVRKGIQKEFPNDPMMQELHELRARFPFSRKTTGGKIAEKVGERATKTSPIFPDELFDKINSV